MYIDANVRKVVWEGEVHARGMLFFVDTEAGGKLALTLGSVCPENWQGKRIRVTVELLDDDNVTRCTKSTNGVQCVRPLGHPGPHKIYCSRRCWNE